MIIAHEFRRFLCNIPSINRLFLFCVILIRLYHKQNVYEYTIYIYVYILRMCRITRWKPAAVHKNQTNYKSIYITT